MNRLNFKDTRGDEYTFIRYSTNDVKVTKRLKARGAFYQIEISAEAVEKFHELLNSEGASCQSF